MTETQPAKAVKLSIPVTINGQAVILEAAANQTLLDALRDAGYKSVKRGCEEGDCGTCSVLVDGQLMRACLLYVGQVFEREVTTVEGLGTAREPHVIQQAYVDAGAVQCGFCTPGMILGTKALLDQRPDPSDEEIRDALEGQLCRCTGYVKIIDAVRLAAERLREGGDQ